jgi:MYXO-CTERM domain-containing protein
MRAAADGAELDVAARTWSDVACTSFRAAYGGESSVTPADDGINAVFFHRASWPTNLEPGVVAQTVLSFDGNGDIHDADIHLNGVDHVFSLDGAPGTQDVRSVLVHEMGHALGLDHVPDARATMAVAGSGLRWRSLEKVDRDAVCALYPGTGAAGCGVLPCPAGFSCVAGRCQNAGTKSDVCSPCVRETGACEAAGDDARCIDLGSGRVCGRACTGDAECGVGFACRPTTEAGDLQCVSLEDCRNGANVCTTNAECAGATCQNGACVGAGEPSPGDAGADAASDAGTPTSPVDGGGSGCDCRTHDAPVSGLSLVAALAVFLFVRIRRRAR